MSNLSFLSLKQRQYSSFGLYFVLSSDPGLSDESIGNSLSDYESSDDLSSEGEREEDDLYHPLPFRLVNVPLMKTQIYLIPIPGIKLISCGTTGSKMRESKRSLKLIKNYFGCQRKNSPNVPKV